MVWRLLLLVRQRRRILHQIGGADNVIDALARRIGHFCLQSHLAVIRDTAAVGKLVQFKGHGITFHFSCKSPLRGLGVARAKAKRKPSAAGVVAHSCTGVCRTVISFPSRMYLHHYLTLLLRLKRSHFSIKSYGRPKAFAPAAGCPSPLLPNRNHAPTPPMITTAKRMPIASLLFIYLLYLFYCLFCKFL